MVGMVGGVLLFLLEVAEVFQACNKIWKNKWQVGTWPRFVMPNKKFKDTRKDKKEARKLNKDRKQGYINTV